MRFMWAKAVNTYIQRRCRINNKLTKIRNLCANSFTVCSSFFSLHFTHSFWIFSFLHFNKFVIRVPSEWRLACLPFQSEKKTNQINWKCAFCRQMFVIRKKLLVWDGNLNFKMKRNQIKKRLHKNRSQMLI